MDTAKIPHAIMIPVPAQRERIFWVCVTIVFLALLAFPYLLAARSAPPDHVFGGFLSNPLDGNSYLAKMYIGWRGGWRFTLPYTAEPGAGAYLYTFYILLGHLARWSGLSLVFTFHAARLLCGAILLFTLARFLQAYLVETRAVWLAMLLAAFGSGLGWLALPFGVFTSDFWVAEAYPFLSGFTNPHFPLSLALLLILLTPAPEPALQGFRRIVVGVLVGLASAALASMSPFAVVVAGMVCCGTLMWGWIRKEGSIGWMVERLVWIGIGGIPMLSYQLVSIRSDALLAGWNAQNQTPSPPAWDVLVALSPPVVLALFSLVKAGQVGFSGRLLLVWMVSALLLLIIPFSLQRRFLVGVYVPLAALASLVMASWISDTRRFWLRGIMILVLVVPTNLLILQAASHGIRVKDEQLFLSRGEADALAWIEAETAPGALILASPEMGLFIPAHTGRRVLYGHPYETVHAEERKQMVEQFYRGESLPDAWLQSVDYVFYGPRERAYGGGVALDGFSVAYNNDLVQIYKVK